MRRSWTWMAGGLLASFSILAMAAPAAALESAGSATTISTDAAPTTTTVPAPTSVQTTYLYLHGRVYSGHVNLFLPGGSNGPVTMRLWLSQDLGPFPCTVTTAGGTASTTTTPAPTHGGIVAAEQVTCVATRLPLVTAPVLEIEIPAANALFLPVMLRNDSKDFRIAAWPLGFGALAGLVALVAAFLLGVARRMARLPTPPKLKFTDPVGADAAWTASDSWVTNLTTVAGILGTVLAGSGLLTTVLVGVPLEHFEVMLLVFGLLGALGPLAYGVFTKATSGAGTDGAKVEGAKADGAKSTGTVLGVLMASLLTLTSAFGELIAVALLVAMAPASAIESWLLYLGLLVCGAVVAWYSVRAVADLIESADRFTHRKPKSALTHSGLISGTL